MIDTDNPDKLALLQELSQLYGDRRDWKLLMQCANAAPHPFAYRHMHAIRYHPMQQPVHDVEGAEDVNEMFYFKCRL